MAALRVFRRRITSCRDRFCAPLKTSLHLPASVADAFHRIRDQNATTRRRRRRLRARRAWRMAVIVAASIAAGAVAVGFAKLCDLGIDAHVRLAQVSPWAALALLPLGLVLATWLTRKVAPEASGSGIPQVIAASEETWPGKRADPRISLKTAGFKILAAAFLLLCGASIGREGPTVQVCAAIIFALTSNLRGGPTRRALLVAGGAAGVAAAFNTPIAGVVFAVEEIAKGFDRRSNAVIILVVVASGAAAYALSGDYAYFGEMRGSTNLASAWIAAPIVGAICGLAGGAFSRTLAAAIGPASTPITRFKARRPLVFAGLCGLLAALAALLSHGLSYGAGYGQAKSLFEGHPGRGLVLATSKWVATLAASASGAPGGLFAPSLATGAGIGSAFARIAPWLVSSRDMTVLGMAGYLAGVVQAPLTSAVILMEMTRDPALVGPLMLSTLTARAVSARVMDEPLYHRLAMTWRRRPD